MKKLPALAMQVCSARTQALACLHTSSGAAPKPQRGQPSSARQPVQRRQPRPAARRLAVHASAAVYGSEWATPKDAYLTVVRGGC